MQSTANDAATQALIKECCAALLPTANLIAQLRGNPTALREVLKHHCNAPLSLDASTTSTAPLWILQLFQGTDQMKSTRALLSAQGNSVCGKSLTARSVAYKCLSCGSDPTCIMCAECFQRSPCRNHDYRMVHSGGGMCDCGDPTAWKKESFCEAHKGTDDENPLRRLPPDFVAWVLEAIRASIRFIIRCFRCAIEEASVNEETAGQESIVRTSQNMVAKLIDFAGISDAARRLVALALASPCDVDDVTSVPVPREDAAMADESDDEDDLGDDDAIETSSSSSAGEEDADSDEETQTKLRVGAADLFEWVTAPSAVLDESAAGADEPADAPASPVAAAKQTLLDQLFLLDMAVSPKSAQPISADIGKLCGAVGIDTEFRKAYLRAYAATAWHHSLCAREKGVMKSGKTTYLKGGQFDTLAVQVLTVGPIVNTVLTPPHPGGPTLLSAMVGSHLAALGARCRKVTNSLGFDLLVERRRLRRRLAFSLMYHLRYINYTSFAPKLLLSQRHITRAFAMVLASRQASEYRIERSQERRDMDFDMWDLDGLDASMAWILHNNLTLAGNALVKSSLGGEALPPLATLLQLPDEFAQPNSGSLAPPVSLGVPHFEKAVAHALNYAGLTPGRAIERTALADAVVRSFGAFFVDLGEMVTHIAASQRCGAKRNAPLVNALIQVNHGRGSDTSERRVVISRLNILAEESPFTLHLSLSRALLLQVKAVLDAAATSPAAAADNNSVVASLVYDCILARGQLCDSEITIPYFIDASLIPFLCLSQYVEQLWRTDYCAMHKHINIYYSFMNGYNQELDLYALQIMTAALGGSFVSAHLLSRFQWGAPDTKRAPTGLYHYLRYCLSIVTDTSKSAVGDALETRIVHALARRQLKRSDLDRIVASYEMDDDQQQLALDQQIERVLKAVATSEKRKDGNVFRLKPESWKLVNPYHGQWTPHDAETSAENFITQNKTHFAKLNEKMPALPAVHAPVNHNKLLHRVVELTHTPAVMSVAVAILLSRAHASISTSSKPAPAPKSHVIAAIDTLTLSVATAKALAATEDASEYPDWRDAYESAIGKIRQTACFVGDVVNHVSQLGRMLPIQLRSGLLHHVLDTAPTVLKLAGTEFKFKGKDTIAALLQLLVDQADKLLEDIPAMYVAALKAAIRAATEASSADAVPSATAEQMAAVDAKASTEAEAAKKAALKARQAALMAKLRQKNSESALVAEATSSSASTAAPMSTTAAAAAGESASTPDAASSACVLHLGDCLTVFETIDNRCVFCAENSTPDRPLFHMAQRATSDVLRQLYSPSTPTELVTGHLNFCGHMAHEDCFTRRVTHIGDLRNRGSNLSQLQAYLQGLHYKGVRYLTQAEALCPLCSRANSILCPPTSNGSQLPKETAFAMRAASAVTRTDIGRLFKVSDFTPIHKRLRSDPRRDPNGDSDAAVDADLDEASSPTKLPDEEVITAWAALRTTAQQASIAGIASSCGKMTTVRTFAGFAAMVTATAHVLAALKPAQQETLLCLLRAGTRYREHHTLAASIILASAFPANPAMQAFHRETADAHHMGMTMSHSQMLAQRAQLRTSALLVMALTNRPLSGQRAKLSTVGSIEELASRLDFTEFDAVAGSTRDAEIAKLRGLVVYCFASNDVPEASPQPDDPTATQADSSSTSDDVVEVFRASLVAKFTARLARKYAEQYEIFGQKALTCSKCGHETQSLVKCLECGALLCSRGAKPELKAHAAQCGSGTQIYLELQTTRLVVVQAINQRASTLPSLYVDRNGETDVGLRRGLPLQLDDDRTFDAAMTWLTCGWDHLTSVLHQDTWLIDQREI